MRRRSHVHWRSLWQGTPNFNGNQESWTKWKQSILNTSALITAGYKQVLKSFECTGQHQVEIMIVCILVATATIDANAWHIIAKFDDLKDDTWHGELWQCCMMVNRMRYTQQSNYDQSSLLPASALQGVVIGVSMISYQHVMIYKDTEDIWWRKRLQDYFWITSMNQNTWHGRQSLKSTKSVTWQSCSSV